MAFTISVTVRYLSVLTSTLALAACGGGSSKSSEAAARLKVALVTDLGKVNDGTFNQYAYEGGTKAAKDLDLQFDFKESTDQADYEKNIESFATSAYDMIVTVGFLMSDATKAAAEKYPGIKFAIVDNAYDSTPSNLMGIVYREDQAAYLAGALAGSMSTTKKIGAIGGIAIPPVKKFVNGYARGVAKTCTDCTVTCVYVKSFASPDVGATEAQKLLDSDVDVVFGAGGATGAGAVKKAAQKGAWAIGVDQDEYYTTFKAGAETSVTKLLSSAIKRVDESVYDAIKQFKDGEFKSGTSSYDLAANGVGLAPFHNAEASVSAEIKTTLADIEAQLRAGTLDTGVSSATGDMIDAATDPACTEVDVP